MNQFPSFFFWFGVVVVVVVEFLSSSYYIIESMRATKSDQRFYFAKI